MYICQDKSIEAKRYNTLKVWARILDASFIILFLISFQFLLSARLKSFVFAMTSGFYFALGLYLFTLSFFYYVLSFPLHFFSSFIVERWFGLSGQCFANWFKDDVKNSLLSFVVFLTAFETLYGLLRHFTRFWWLGIALFWFLATVFLAKITPVFIIPLFFKYSEVEQNLKEKILALAKDCKIKVLDVYKINLSRKTNKVNAAVVGLGKTRRVILGDNLIDNFTEGEIKGVLAHEFAHHKFSHMWKLLAFGGVSTFFSFFMVYLLLPRAAVFLEAEGISDVKILPILLLILFLTEFFMLPFQNGFSRKLERQADIFALNVTHDGASFISLMSKLARKNLADPNPPRLVKLFFYDHPPISERISYAS